MGERVEEAIAGRKNDLWENSVCRSWEVWIYDGLIILLVSTTFLIATYKLQDKAVSSSATYLLLDIKINFLYFSTKRILLFFLRIIKPKQKNLLKKKNLDQFFFFLKRDPWISFFFKFFVFIRIQSYLWWTQKKKKILTMMRERITLYIFFRNKKTKYWYEIGKNVRFFDLIHTCID